MRGMGPRENTPPSRGQQRAEALTLLFCVGAVTMLGGVSSSGLIAKPQDSNRVPGTAQSDEEFEAYQLALKPRAPEEAARSAKEFLKRYPERCLTPNVHKAAIIAYQQLHERAKVILYAEAKLKTSQGMLQRRRSSPAYTSRMTDRRTPLPGRRQHCGVPLR